jgi:hypothetical protein
MLKEWSVRTGCLALMNPPSITRPTRCYEWHSDVIKGQTFHVSRQSLYRLRCKTVLVECHQLNLKYLINLVQLNYRTIHEPQHRAPSSGTSQPSMSHIPTSSCLQP